MPPGTRATAERWDQSSTSSLFEPAFRRGALIEPDGMVVAMTLPPDGIPITTTSTAGGKMFRLGLDTASGDQEPLAAPWAFDPATNTWAEIAAPDWMGDCEFECTWGQPHERGDVAFEVSTSTGVARITPDGTLGFLDAATLTWRRLDDPPFPLTYRQQVPVSDRWIVSMPYGESYDETASTDVGVLDLESGTWHRYGLLTGPLPTVWESASTTAGFVFQPVADDDQTSPWLVVNPTTGVPTIAGDDAIAAMTAQIATEDVNGSGQPIEELIAELSAAT